MTTSEQAQTTCELCSREANRGTCHSKPTQKAEPHIRVHSVDCPSLPHSRQDSSFMSDTGWSAAPKAIPRRNHVDESYSLPSTSHRPIQNTSSESRETTAFHNSRMVPDLVTVNGKRNPMWSPRLSPISLCKLAYSLNGLGFSAFGSFLPNFESSQSLDGRV